MNPEQIQEAIQGMLTIQRELQNSQLRQLEETQEITLNIREITLKIREITLKIQELTLNIRELTQNASQQQSILNQLIGYSISAESDILTLQERMDNLETRLRMQNNP